MPHWSDAILNDTGAGPLPTIRVDIQPTRLVVVRNVDNFKLIEVPRDNEPMIEAVADTLSAMGAKYGVADLTIAAREVRRSLYGR